ncbi:MAG: PilT/PilU family type 4a pilus ATPase [Coriobacteriales bacterium]|nr:PilT/PilU family type 4a pilus ATPase [Coriobacteriales bacterium]
MSDKKVLIVHADADVAREIGRAVTLASPEFHVSTALTAPRALGMAVADKPDVVVVEAELEGVDGYTFTRQLKDEAEMQDVPVVIVALDPSEASALKARQVGAAAHMPGRNGSMEQVAHKVASLAQVSLAASTSPNILDDVVPIQEVPSQPAAQPAAAASGAPGPVAGFSPSPAATLAEAVPAVEPEPLSIDVDNLPAPSAAPAAQARPEPTVTTQAPNAEDIPHVDDLLRLLLDRGGSDLHITVGSPPGLRLRGEIIPVENVRPLTPRDTMEMILGLLSEEQRRRFETELELDFAYSIPGVSRFRSNVFQQRNSMGAVFRVIPIKIPTIDDLALPKVCSYLADRPRGLVLVTGPTGSGKSTTLAAMIDHINDSRAVHIITLEDPIEFMHRNKLSYVNQREIGEDTHSFASALKRVLRQDPDVILVGEMRDLETISAAITAAETGHLVLATLHTTGAPESVDRIIDVFPPHQQAQVRMQLSTTLQGILSQTLLRSTDGRSRVMAMEIMLGIPAISNLIREGKTHQMMTIIQGGAQLGMQSLDQHLKNLLQAGKITFEEAVSKAKHPRELAEMVGRKL